MSILPRLGAEPLEYLERNLFCMLALLAQRADARGATTLARACRDQLSRARKQNSGLLVQRLGKSDSAWIGIIEIEIRLEKFPLFLLEIQIA